MICNLCDLNEAEKLVVEHNGITVHIEICDECLMASDDDSFALTNLVQAKIDILGET